jgi:hypothetical protein
LAGEWAVEDSSPTDELRGRRLAIVDRVRSDVAFPLIIITASLIAVVPLGIHEVSVHIATAEAP